MNPPFQVTLDIAQIMLLAGLIWGLARMSASIDTLRTVTASLNLALEHLSSTMQDMVTRVRVLEDRDVRPAERRRP